VKKAAKISGLETSAARETYHERERRRRRLLKRMKCQLKSLSNDSLRMKAMARRRRPEIEGVFSEENIEENTISERK
jgi:hypothetical protein